ncbi:hypothetical protein Zmor_027594 [Zophobas morio]|uniref:Lipase n=1 Tax=Zophobas morio TaxID=2755281 RepID=A0AA38HNT1_9CUCU|nr:hypothetical protein Zmor_027594 [Zophobas morio]
MWSPSPVTILGSFLFIYLYAITRKREDALSTIPEILTKHGYPSEVHHVTTPDGYILTLHRIPHGRNNTNSNKPVLVLQGILLSSRHFVFMGVEQSLGYILADEGYDVWLADVRGCYSSRNHTTLNPDKDPKFWYFSWDEMGTIDVPVLIDYILETTHQPNLYYVCYSQGSALFLIAMSTHPEYNAKVKVHVGLAPVAYLNHKKTHPFQIVAHWNVVFDTLLAIFGIDEFPPPIFTFMKRVTCRVSPDFCNYVFMVLFGYKASEVNSTVLKIFLEDFPIPVSRKHAVHVLQLIESGYFRRYDFGGDNIEVYGTSTPPSFNLSAITAKSHLLYSDEDDMVTDVEIDKLCEDLGDACAEKFLITEGTIRHLDWVIGTGVQELGYSKLLSVMANY